MMDTSKERIEALKKLPNLKEYFEKNHNWDTELDSDVDIWLPRIDQHLAILKEKGFYPIMYKRSLFEKWWVQVWKPGILIKEFEAPTLEQALD